jgi:hypothetical protein
VKDQKCWPSFLLQEMAPILEKQLQAVQRANMYQGMSAEVVSCLLEPT